MAVGCSEEDAPQQGNQLVLSSLTRADASTRITTDGGKTMLFVTTPNEEKASGVFSYGDSRWNNSDGLSIAENTVYYIYGYYVPVDGLVTGSSVSKPEGYDFSRGADLRMEGLPLFTSEDICVVVGVERVKSAVTQNNAQEGSFGYNSGISSENYVNLLLDHLYSQLQLRFNVDATYSALRTIHLKSVTLKSSYGTAANATVKLRKEKGLADQVSSGSVVNNQIFSSQEGQVLPVAGDGYYALEQAVNCPHSLFDGSNLTVECTYDVYDKASTPTLLSTRTAVNKIKASGMGPGVKKVLTLTVTPTYLYQLSEPDLDNPGIVIN